MLIKSYYKLVYLLTEFQSFFFLEILSANILLMFHSIQSLGHDHWNIYFTVTLASVINDYQIISDSQLRPFDALPTFAGKNVFKLFRK